MDVFSGIVREGFGVDPPFGLIFIKNIMFII
jgi:hypothetical protein